MALGVKEPHNEERAPSRKAPPLAGRVGSELMSCNSSLAASCGQPACRLLDFRAGGQGGLSVMIYPELLVRSLW